MKSCAKVKRKSSHEAYMHCLYILQTGRSMTLEVRLGPTVGPMRHQHLTLVIR